MSVEIKRDQISTDKATETAKEPVLPPVRSAVVAGIREQARVDGAAGTSIAETAERSLSLGSPATGREVIADGANTHENAVKRKYSGAVVPPAGRSGQVGRAAEIPTAVGEYGAAVAANQAETILRQHGATDSQIETQRGEAAETARQMASSVRSAANAKQRLKSEGAA